MNYLRPIFLSLLLSILQPNAGAAVELELELFDSFLWAQGSCLSDDSGLVAVGSPNGIRFFEEQADGQFALVGEHVVPGGVRDLIVREDNCYFATSLGELAVVGITDPANPEDFGAFGTGDPAEALTLCSGWLIAAGPGNIRSFNLALPHHPTIAGELLVSGNIADVVGEDSLILVPQGSEGIRAVILHSDGALTSAGLYHIADPAPGFPVAEAATNGRYAWIPLGADGVLVVDFSDPFHPASASRIVTFGRAEHVSLAGDRLLVADAVFGLISYRLLIPEVPFWQHELIDLRAIKKLWPSTNHRFYGTEGTDLFAIDVSLLGRVSVGGRISQPGGLARVARYKDFGYIPDRGGVYCLNGRLADSEDSLRRIIGGRPVFDAIQHRSLLITAEGKFGVRISDIDPAGSIHPRSVIPPQFFATGVCALRDTLITIENGEGFQIYDITRASTPNFLGRSRRSRQFPAGAFPNNRYFYLSEEGGRVEIYDLRFPVKPVRIGSLTDAASVQQLTVDGNSLYAADPAKGVLVYNISNPSSPSLRHQFPDPPSATAFRRSGRTLYTGDASGCIMAIDIGNPEATSVIATTYVTGRVAGIAKFAERLWITTDAALYAVDVVPPLIPGDVESDGDVDALDLVRLIDYIFAAGPPPYRPNAADVSADGFANLVDVVRLISFLYSGGPSLQHGMIE